MRRKLRVWWVVACAMGWGWTAVAQAQGVPEAPGQELSAPRSDAPQPPPRAVVIDAAPHGIDPVVGEHVTQRMRATLEDMGYEVVGRGDTVAAARHVRMAYPPSPADLWRVTHAAGAIRGAFARVWAEGGRYVVVVTAASLDGTGPFEARGHADAETLHREVARLTGQAVPDPAAWDATAAARLHARPSRAPATRDAAGPMDMDAEDGERWGTDRAPPVEPPSDKTPRHRFELALQTEAAIGMSSDRFYNHLLGLRLGFRINEDLIVSAYLAYANLRGRGNRSNNLLPYLQVEHRVRIGDRDVVNIPLRAAIGYLPFNGPVIRLAAGLNFPLGDRVELGLDLLSPTFWILPGTAAVSYNLATELIVRL